MRTLPLALIFLLFLPLVVGCGGRNPKESQRDTPPSSLETQPLLLTFGDSITAGLGVSQEQAWPSLLERRLAEKGSGFRVVNAGISGDTSSGGLARVDWVLKQKPQVVLLELGANDALRGLPVAEMEKNLSSLIDRCQEAGARVVLLGMLAPPSMGEDYGRAFREAFQRLGRRPGVTWVPFFLEGVAGEPELNQADGVHPTAKGHEILMETAWKALMEGGILAGQKSP